MKEPNNNQEVEVRALLTPRLRSHVVQLINNSGGQCQGLMEIKDTYWCLQSVSSFEEIEMNKVGSYSLRTRYSNKGGTETKSINVKVITKQSDHRSWQEFEITVNSSESAEAILQVLGFKKFFTLVKRRKIFKLNSFTINLEDIRGFGPVIEVEVMTTRNKSSRAKSEIITLLEKLSVPKKKIVSKSITNLLMHQKAKF